MSRVRVAIDRVVVRGFPDLDSPETFAAALERELAGRVGALGRPTEAKREKPITAPVGIDGGGFAARVAEAVTAALNERSGGGT